MPTGVTALEKTLIGVEALAGATTDVVTTHWRGMGKIKDRREIVFPPEKVGKFGGTSRSYIPRTGGEVTLEGDATFEQLPYILNAAIYLTTPTTDTSSASLRTWDVQKSSSDAYATTDLGTLVVESGDNAGIEISRYAFVKSFTLSGKQGEAWQLSATLETREPSTSASFTAVGDTDLQNPAETMLFSKSYLYIDPSSDTAGTTLTSETLLDATLNFTSGWVAIPAKDGRTDFSNIKRVDDEITLDVAFEHNSTAEAAKTAWRNQTEQVIQIKTLGSALSSTDAGATYDTKAFVMNLYGKWQTFGADGLEEQDGDNIYRGTFKVAYCSTPDNKMRFIIANETATLP